MQIKNLTITVSLLFALPVFSQSMDDAVKLFEEKKISQAKSIFDKLYKSNSKDAKLNYYTGIILTGNDFLDVDEAIDRLEFAVEKESKNAKYHYALGNAYGLKARTGMIAGMKYGPKFKEQNLEASKLDPGYVEPKINLLRFYLNAPSIMGGSVDEAKKLAGQIEKLDAAKGYSVWSDIYKKEGNDAKYEEYLKKSLELNPTNSQLINNYGYWLLGKKRFDEAIIWFKKNAELSPNDPNSFDSLGDGFAGKNQTDEALKSYLKAVSIDPKFSASVINAAKIYSKKNQKTEAVNLLKNYIRIASNPDEKEKAEDLLDELD